MTTFRLSLIALTAAVACFNVHAQPRAVGPGPQAFGPASFETFDRDGSGTISEAEFDAVRSERRTAAAKAGMPMRGAASSLSFQEIDSDGDGQLTRAEFDAAHANQVRPGMGRQGPGMGRGAGMAQGRGADRGMGAGMGAAGMGPASFDDFDRDGSGTISEAEFDALRSERRTAAAQAGMPMRGAASSLTFQQIDRDGDGQLTRAEFDAAHANQPRPGMGRQAPGMGRGAGPGMGAGMGRAAGAGAGAGMNQPLFSDFDLNGDGHITEPEFHAARSGRISSRLQEGRQMRNLQDAGSFADIDTNGDGRISRAEFSAHQAARARARAAGR